MLTTDELRAFLLESNKIEGYDTVTDGEVREAEDFLREYSLAVIDLVCFVKVTTGDHYTRGTLRDRPGLDVRVGNHRPPPGGPEVRAMLGNLLHYLTPAYPDAYTTHRAYESLHPFTDGNGRSGRLLWLWQMVRGGQEDYVRRYGFLQGWYYQSLGAER